MNVVRSRDWFGGRAMGSRLLWKVDVDSQKPLFRSSARVMDPISSPPCLSAMSRDLGCIECLSVIGRWRLVQWLVVEEYHSETVLIFLAQINNTFNVE